jgi:hypothetical protein
MPDVPSSEGWEQPGGETECGNELSTPTVYESSSGCMLTAESIENAEARQTLLPAASSTVANALIFELGHVFP